MVLITISYSINGKWTGLKQHFSSDSDNSKHLTLKPHSLIRTHKRKHIHTPIQSSLGHLGLSPWPRGTSNFDRRKLDLNLCPKDCKTTMLPTEPQSPLFNNKLLKQYISECWMKLHDLTITVFMSITNGTVFLSLLQPAQIMNSFYRGLSFRFQKILFMKLLQKSVAPFLIALGLDDLFSVLKNISNRQQGLNAPLSLRLKWVSSHLTTASIRFLKENKWSLTFDKEDIQSNIAANGSLHRH